MLEQSTTYSVGDASITRVTEQHFQLKAATLFADFDAAVIQEHRAWLADGQIDAAAENLLLNVNTWVVRVGGKVILIDTASGNHKDRPFSALFHQLNTPYIERLARAGVTPEEVDFVLLTHLHVDHVGWNTRLDNGRWVPTFPNARYVFSGAERQFFDTPAGESRRMVFDDSLLPVIEAGLADEIGPQGGEYLPGIRFHPTAGHSAGHMSIEIESAGAHALFSGDVWHHPIQVYRPAWSSVFCADKTYANVSRRWVLDRAVETDATVFTPHFAGTSAGVVAQDNGGFTWRFL
ncbi:MBL fold metallo-hydrolase [Paraburkholderia sp. SEWSISQ10-3 4]|uniref:Glyoxylase, beta-lactamase superfamily II n=1 Tax=Paraburkholderia aspalathi TaxID=1324617 RepID=A0A1I7EKX4_9BURK|nr:MULTISPECIES: MBL fold metallo-hydrolase [Paraburkholderia]MCX4141126.1 MBL fold metallo-hydrolase [Paraburkholderia aspalathi]MDN7173809.1 MBL fold metallo-hydrolase [Paraburkholderia sp. SEWSISQ10-3 4]MDQ6503450.1 MBL fold metallo-hydrolase [Paraburkholderia aspalathi]SFU24598.1 Glyoxylase, beta-lactamase superfamily II [Paraburkholderia aspalathi]